MSIGKMKTLIDLIVTKTTKDSEGFSTKKDTIIASVRAYKEDRFAGEKWANMAAFSEANALFRFRRIPDIEVTTSMVITCKDGRFEIISVRDIRNQGMYTEVLARKVVASSG
ncbi:MAG: head-tail adaptor protein [Desulfitobacteriaceae bacterium]|jgi:head-tail adaptor|nr:head-tail adaptor protein [Desulfitobacteriaceae bacterium]